MSSLREAVSSVAVVRGQSPVKRPRRDLGMRPIDLDSPCAYPIPPSPLQKRFRDGSINSASISASRSTGPLRLAAELPPQRFRHCLPVRRIPSRYNHPGFATFEAG